MSNVTLLAVHVRKVGQLAMKKGARLVTADCAMGLAWEQFYDHYRSAGQQEGRKEGRKEGKEDEEGREDGMKEGRKEGSLGSLEKDTCCWRRVGRKKRMSHKNCLIRCKNYISKCKGKTLPSLIRLARFSPYLHIKLEPLLLQGA